MYMFGAYEMWNRKPTKEKAQFIFNGTLEYSEFTWAHVNGYVFVGGIINDYNEALAVALRGSVWHYTCMARMRVVFIPTNAHFSLCGKSFLWICWSNYLRNAIWNTDGYLFFNV